MHLSISLTSLSSQLRGEKTAKGRKKHGNKKEMEQKKGFLDKRERFICDQCADWWRKMMFRLLWSYGIKKKNGTVKNKILLYSLYPRSNLSTKTFNSFFFCHIETSFNRLFIRGTGGVKLVMCVAFWFRASLFYFVNPSTNHSVWTVDLRFSQ